MAIVKGHEPGYSAILRKVASLIATRLDVSLLPHRGMANGTFEISDHQTFYYETAERGASKHAPSKQPSSNEFVRLESKTVLGVDDA